MKLIDMTITQSLREYLNLMTIEQRAKFDAEINRLLQNFDNTQLSLNETLKSKYSVPNGLLTIEMTQYGAIRSYLLDFQRQVYFTELIHHLERSHEKLYDFMDALQRTSADNRAIVMQEWKFIIDDTNDVHGMNIDNEYGFQDIYDTLSQLSAQLSDCTKQSIEKFEKRMDEMFIVRV
jgi:hypothetical protein